MQNNYEKIGIMLFIDGINDNEMSQEDGPPEDSVSASLGQIGFLWYVAIECFCFICKKRLYVLHLPHLPMHLSPSFLIIGLTCAWVNMM